MRKIYALFSGVIVCAALIFAFYPNLKTLISGSKNQVQTEEAYYSNPKERDLLEFEKIKDPSLGYVPTTRLAEAIEFTENQKALLVNNKVQSLLWTERGPIFDSVGPSNGNGRGGSTGYTGAYTSGRIRGVLVDTANDPSGNTVFAGGVAGGLWKCTNFLTNNPHWEAIDDRFNNLAVSSICQDPGNSQVMYFATGEATSNADAVFGRGVWKSTNGGATWNHLPSTTNFIRNFKILCDAAGNVYLAARPTSTPASQPFGLLRSTNGGDSWTNITPTGLTANSNCTDIEISSTGRMHASFGYVATIVNHRYTDNPATVTPGGWSASAGIRQFIKPATGRTDTARRMELAVHGDVVYAVTVNRLDNIDSCYKSVDGGVTFTKQNNTIFPSGLGSSQGWYNLTLAINPSNTDEIIIGGLDAYRSVNGGQTVSRLTFWIGAGRYVHADHHFIQWWNKNGESRILIGCDGGLYYSKDAGNSWVDKNKGLAIKQFYACTIHPEAGSPYLLAGSQDNGSHQLKQPGLSYSHEVTGGDGCFVHINQQNPNIQFTSYVFNNYRRSTNGGATWSQVNFADLGLFVNPFDYDDATNTMYASYKPDTIIRWLNAHTSNSAGILGLTGLGRGTAFKVSPHTANRVFIGGDNALFRLNNANTVTNATVPANRTNIRGAAFPAGAFLSCVNVGTSDDFLVVVFSNYGVNNVWYSNNAGVSWTAIDGNLPDMPVRWAVFEPGDNNKLLLATEAGVYSTEMVDGANTMWKPNPSFPTVRTDMLKVRTSDNTIVAATHGRGLFTAVLPMNNDPVVNFAGVVTNAKEEVAHMDGCRGYKDYIINVGLMNEAEGDATVTINVQGGSTAVKEVDFDFTTNNDFTNPSSTLTFADGSTGLKPVRVRIYDDAEVDPNEYFTLTLSVSGETNATAGGQHTHTFNIADEDMAPRVYAPSTHAVGTFNGNMNAQSPFAGNRVKHRMQALFYSSELKAAGLYGEVDLMSIAINVITKGSTKPYNGLTVSMANSASSTLASGFAPEALTQVYNGAYTTVVGENLIRFNTPFKWDGKSNLIVQFCFDNAGQPADAAADIVEGNTVPLGAGVRGTTYSNFTTGATAGCSLGAAFVSDFRMNATFGALFGNPIATALNTNKTEYMAANNDLYFYSSKGEIIARVRNLGAHHYGCSNIKIDRAGTGAASFWNKNKKNFVMDKTYLLVPATNDPDGRYEVTLYYTKEEKAGWEAATGNSWNDIQLIKTSGRISDVTPQNAQPNNNGTVQEVVETVKGTYDDGYTLTAVFESGFGGIGAGMPGRQFNNNRVDITTSGGAAASQQMVVLTNPFRNNIQVRFSKMPATVIEATLYDIQGRVVKKYKAAASQTLVLNVSDVQLGTGTYLLNVTADRQVYKAKLLKKE
jgi:trimeric autotransporter adhesin